MLIFILALLAASPPADDSERAEAYDAMLGCAAFHTIESSAKKGDEAEAQLAIAYDFAGVAAKLSPDGQSVTANADLEMRLTEYRAALDSGDVRDIAEDWTNLESACRELYPVRNFVGATPPDQPAQR
jgi:hypothetical protein